MEEPSWTAPPGMTQPMGIQSTAGAVPIMNDKGEVSMKKVKVQRYVSGKRPEYAPASSDEEVSDDEDFTKPRSGAGAPVIQSTKTLTQAELSDPRLRRLMANRQDLPESDEEEEDHTSRRPVHQAEVVEMSDHEDEEMPEAVAEEEPVKVVEEEKEEKKEEEEEEEEMEEEEEEEEMEQEDEEEEEETEIEKEQPQPVGVRYIREGEHHRLVDSDSESEDEVDEEQLEQRRLRLRELAMKKAQQEEELLGKEDEGSEESSEEESSEYDEEETDSEEEGPRLKPVFVRRKDRVTLHQKEQQEAKVKQVEVETRRRAEERRRETLRMIERENREANNLVDKHDPIESVNTDDEGDEAEYEAWKLRELRRLKRDKEEREAAEKEREEVERLRNLTEEERRIELRNNPKVVTNKAQKGKYKFLQKYYHRGAFYMDQEEDIFRRDFSGATLEDHFDKTILPKVMQVKNFGRSGRTKYTHLVDQDTTSFDSPWAADSQMNHKFFNGNAGGMKQVFEKPTSKKRQVAGVQNNVARK